MKSAPPAAGPDAGELVSVLNRMRTESGRTSGTFAGLTISSQFQPIYSLAHGRPVGFEAFMRATDPRRLPVPPLQAFERQAEFAERLTLDRLARAVHLNNFIALEDKQSWLFLNIRSEVFLESNARSRFFKDLLDAYEFPTHRLVIEVLAQTLTDNERLIEAVDFYRNQGFLIALDDFGAGHSNFDRIWTLQPDIVKLDRSIIAQAGSNPRVRRMMPVIVSLMHEAGSLVLVKGIETESEALIAMDADAEFVQGDYFGRPDEGLPDAEAGNRLLENLWQDFHDVSLPESSSMRQEIVPYRNAIGYAASLMESGLPLDRAATGFLDLTGAERCFVLDANGRQLGDSLVHPNYARTADKRFAPLENAKGANWSRRFYFRRALDNPSRVQVTRPYLSVPAGNQCVTVSIGFQVDNETRVLCGDIAWRDRAANKG